MESAFFKDYAKKESRQSWLRHPVFGDPSFDSFQKLGKTVHHSAPPLDWAVNGSLFRDFDGSWYYCAGLYPYGYAIGEGAPGSVFLLYRSTDKGQSWQCLGDPFEGDGDFILEGASAPVGSYPDAVIQYDAGTRRYLLTYDYCNRDFSWSNTASSGAALAWAEHPAGPYHRVKTPVISNAETKGLLGCFSRAYATTVIPRKEDYLALTLCDSGSHYAWALAALTAPSMEGPWSRPQLLLSPDLPGYYPTPMEYFPCMVVGDRVYAYATSVAQNRNYQTLHSAPLEWAHLACAWRMEQDGCIWHSRREPEEYYGIWGQTIHGFVEDGQLVVMYPSKDQNNLGTLSVASRPWAQPFSDGFTLSGHGGPALSLTYAAYDRFRLKVRLTVSGTVGVGFGCRSVLEPEAPAADAVPGKRALASCTLLQITAAPAGQPAEWRLVQRNPAGEPRMLTHGELPGRCPEQPFLLELDWQDGVLSLALDGQETCSAAVEGVDPGPLMLTAEPFSMMTCSQFEVAGEPRPWRLSYGAKDALLGAGQDMADWAELPDGSFSGCGPVRAKWNVTGDQFTVWAPKGPEYGTMAVSLDGALLGTVPLKAEAASPSAPVFSTGKVDFGPHSITLTPWEGTIAADVLEVQGPAVL